MTNTNTKPVKVLPGIYKFRGYKIRKNTNRFGMIGPAWSFRFDGKLRTLSTLVAACEEIEYLLTS